MMLLVGLTCSHNIVQENSFSFLTWPPGGAAGFYPCEPSRMQERGARRKTRLLYSVPRSDFQHFFHILIIVIESLYVLTRWKGNTQNNDHQPLDHWKYLASCTLPDPNPLQSSSLQRLGAPSNSRLRSCPNFQHILRFIPQPQQSFLDTNYHLSQTSSTGYFCRPHSYQASGHAVSSRSLASDTLGEPTSASAQPTAIPWKNVTNSPSVLIFFLIREQPANPSEYIFFRYLCGLSSWRL